MMRPCNWSVVLAGTCGFIRRHALQINFSLFSVYSAVHTYVETLTLEIENLLVLNSDLNQLNHDVRDQKDLQFRCNIKAVT